jgi:hypothetical protein
MTIGFIIKGLILFCIIAFYFIYTVRYFLLFRKNIIFTGKIKVFHLITMWLIPFIWILLLKSLLKSTPESYEIEDKSEPIPFSDNDAAKAANMGF